MAYIKSNSSITSWGRLHYIFDEEAHDGSAHRVLGVTGNNIRFWGTENHIYTSQSGYYLNQQFKAVREKAWNKQKRHQAQHVILSFAEEEFSTNDPQKLFTEAGQINQLVKGYMDQNFPSTQWVSAVQCDGEGHKLHAHILINPVKIDGKCIQTDNFNVEKLRRKWNRYLGNNYLAVTGHVYVNPFSNNQPGTIIKPKGWQDQLKQTLEWARTTAKSIEQYLNLLKTKHVTVTERNKQGDWSYHARINGKEKSVRDFYQRIDRKTGLVKSTRGMGQAYTPQALKTHFNKVKEKVKNDEKQSNIRQWASDVQRERQRRLIAGFNERRHEREYEESCNQDGLTELLPRRDVANRKTKDGTGRVF